MAEKQQSKGYLRSSIEELRKVTWPTSNQLVRITTITIGFVIVSALILAVLNFGLGFISKTFVNIAPVETQSTDAPFELSPEDISIQGVDADGGEVQLDVRTAEDGTVEIAPDGAEGQDTPLEENTEQ